MKKDKVLAQIEKYVDSRKQERFVAGKTYISPHGAIISSSDVAAVCEIAMNKWFTEGNASKQFQKNLVEYFGARMRYISLCNSGSSANLLATSAMTAPEFGSKSAKRGDEIITVAAGFPTTISGIIQNGLVPVFVDVDLETFVPDPSVIEQAIVEGKTKGIILAHPLGNPFDAQAIRDICDEYDIFFVEDGCDALGGTYNDQPLGTFGDFSTFSFYPAHQITMGEGGAVATNSLTLSRVVESFRDWGRACFCPTGCDNSCKKRFGWKLGNLPEGYDHKYTYSRIGYNLKLTDMQAALGVSQLTKIDYFVEKRRYNWKRLLDGLEKYSKFIHLPRPTKNSNPAWFGFSMVVKEIAPFSRDQLVAFLNENKIGTRLFFGGNILKQPGFMKIPHKVFGNLWNTDLIMKDAFWIGVWPGITDEMLDYVIDKFDEFMRQYA